MNSILKVLSIDIGITNLGFVYSEINLKLPEFTNKIKAHYYMDNYIKSNFEKNIHVLDCNRIDITRMRHERVKPCDCKLYHENCIPDYIDHFIQETPYFENCDILLLEQQPPQGIQGVECLLFKLFRNKVIMVSPVSVHKYFDLPVNAYDLRKEKSEKIAENYLCEFSKFILNERKHDISDALLMTIFFYKNKMKEIIDSTQFFQELNEFDKFKLVS